MNTVKSSSSSGFEIKPVEIPATCLVKGTPAAINDIQDEHTDACEVEPLLLKISETDLIAYGKSSSAGKTAYKAFSAN